MADPFPLSWASIFVILSVVLGAAAAVHAAMTKEDVRAAIGWVAVIVLSPIIGAVLYAIAGVNRIRRATLTQLRSAVQHREEEWLPKFRVSDGYVSEGFPGRFRALKTLGDRIAFHPLTSGNSILLLEDGDAAYKAMLDAIAAAKRSIILETYIFDRDRIGLRIADALIAASQRGVEVRVLIDAVGARYSVPSIVGYLKKASLKVDVFNGNIIIGLRLPYANLRTHRKIIVIDGSVAFTGGMNIREGFSREFAGADCAHDAHFKVEGPVVLDLFRTAAEDWRFASSEILDGPAWVVAEPASPPATPALMRVVASGPDRRLETNHKMLIGAISIARDSIRIMSPYFLPDRELISALATAALRGVEVDIIVPAANNLKLVDRAMTAQLDQVLKNYCRVWRAQGTFNHSKLLVIDRTWAYVGSSNLDSRSLRLNFEVDLEVLDAGFAGELEEHMMKVLETALPVHLHHLRNRPFPTRLLEKALWLGSPYL